MVVVCVGEEGLRGCAEKFETKMGSGNGILKPKSGFKQWQLSVSGVVCVQCACVCVYTALFLHQP